MTSRPGAATPLPSARPFLKWAGGKTQLLPAIERHLPALPEDARYHEPFVGSGAVFFRLAETGRLAGGAVLSDTNAHLVTTWEQVRDRPAAVARRLEELRSEHDEAAYYEARRRFNEDDLDELERAAVLIYLNKAGFNGLYRVNRRGHFNVPCGRQAGGPGVPGVEQLRACAEALDGVTLLHAAFESVLERARPGDFVYFDPPYVPRSPTAAFTDYDRAGFGPGDQLRLRDAFVELAARGCRVLLSNSGTPEVEDLYARFPIETVRARRSINSRADRRGAVDEVLVRSWGS